MVPLMLLRATLLLWKSPPIFGALGGHKFKESKSLAPGEYKTEYKSSCFRYHGEVMIDKNTFKVCYDELKGQDEYILHKVCLQNWGFWWKF